MTHIASFPTKKAFKEAVQTSANRVWLDDPAIIGAFSGYIADVVDAKGTVYVTNHPKRSWFANVKRDRNGELKVS